MSPCKTVKSPPSGNCDKAKATKTIDARGLVVAPGFIDVHTHIEGDEMVTPTADNFIFDGVTSVVTGNCGGSSRDMAAYFARLDSVKTGHQCSVPCGPQHRPPDRHG